jgi:hypothetical protein
MVPVEVAELVLRLLLQLLLKEAAVAVVVRISTTYSPLMMFLPR